jgi:hypothetical protein
MGKYVSVLLAAVVGACGTAGEGAAPPAPEQRGTVTLIKGSRGLTGEFGGVVVHTEAGVAERHVDAPKHEVLLALSQVYEMLGVPDHGVNPEGNQYGNPSFRARRIEGKRLSNYIDCGMGVTAIPNANDYQVTLMLLSWISEVDEGGTMVVTTVDATAKPRAVASNAVHCQSKGSLETRVGDLVLLVLLQGGP